MHKIPAKTVQKLRRWFRKEMRVLPWRATREIYPIWLSEVMLQQTTVETVKSRFASFMERFPTLSDLANASEQDVLHQWQGLGYYSRARNLHRAAKTIVSKYGEEPPADADFWTALPGVGRYIVGAVLAQAFEQKLPIVEANTRRLWARFFGYRENLKSSTAEKWLWQIAEEILPEKQIGEFHQACMELGALICLPKNPTCIGCPLKEECVAYRENTVDDIPVLQAREKPQLLTEYGFIAIDRSRVLVCQRPRNVRWASMWEFPTFADSQLQMADFAAIRKIASDSTALGSISYPVTRYRVKLYVHIASSEVIQKLPHDYLELRCVTLTELEALPMSTPQRKLIAHVERLLSQSHQVTSNHEKST